MYVPYLFIAFHFSFNTGFSVDNDCVDNWRELIQSIKAKGMRPGVSLKPGTPIEEVYPLVSLNTVLPSFLLFLIPDSFAL